jgi:hypothetical protein
MSASWSFAEAQAGEATATAEVYFAPLPSFEKMFSALDYLEVKDYNLILEKETYKVDEEVFKIAFALGVNTADAVLATKARNHVILQNVARDMYHYSRFLGLSNEILKLGDELQIMVKEQEWTKLETSLEEYKVEVELALFESRQYDLFTMMQLGGWTQGLNRVTHLLMNNYSKDKSDIVNQKGIINTLIGNLDMIRSERLKGTDHFQIARELYEEIRNIIYSYEQAYPEDAIKELYNLTEKIRMSFR